MQLIAYESLISDKLIREHFHRLKITELTFRTLAFVRATSLRIDHFMVT